MAGLTLFDARLLKALEAFEEAFDFSRMPYSSRSFAHYGFQDAYTLHKAVNRAIRICKNLGVEPRKHFRYYYAIDLQKHEASREWRVSKLGFYLVLCNGEPENPYTGSLQLELLRKVLDELG